MLKSGRKSAQTPENGRKEARKFKPFYYNGRKYSLVPDHGVFRLRSRKAGQEVNWSTNVRSRTQAEIAAKLFLDGEITKAETISAKNETLEDVVKVYQRIPRKAGVRSTALNIGRLRSVVRLVLDKDLSEVPISAAGPKLWEEYARLRQGGNLDISLSGRKRVNIAINSALRCARSIFTETLWPAYREHGIEFSPDIQTAHVLPEPKLRKEQPRDGLLWAWKKLYKTDFQLWLCIGIARCGGGLRLAELQAIEKSWLVLIRGALHVDLTDREGYRGKTGQQYYAPVISKILARELQKLPKGLLIQPNLPRRAAGSRTKAGKMKMTRESWFEWAPQKWCKQFVSDAKPLHRMRSLYLADVERRTEDAMLAKEAGKQAAAKAAGHTTMRTRDRNYNEG